MSWMIFLWTELTVAAWEVTWMSMKYTVINAVNKEIIPRAKWNGSEINMSLKMNMKM